MCRQWHCSKGFTIKFTINFKIAIDGYGSTVIYYTGLEIGLFFMPFFKGTNNKEFKRRWKSCVQRLH